MAEYRGNGFTLVPDFLTPTQTAALQEEVLRLKREGKLQNISTEGDGTTHSSKAQNLQICPASPHSEVLRALPFSDSVREVVGQILDGPSRQILDQIFLKPAHHGAGTNWHQDNAYFKTEHPLLGVGMWIAVHTATLENGTMHMARGLQHTVLPHYRDPYSDHHIRCDVDPSLEAECVLPAGGAVFFAFSVPHCTKGNTSDSDRAGLAYHFTRDDNPTCDGFGHKDKPFVTGPGCDGGLTLIGKDYRGEF